MVPCLMEDSGLLFQKPDEITAVSALNSKT
ncbi:uncharacterized protein METZ01_LOCUS281796 [marine metagenome]|uniref:Uncharacterized protein n=1 Tax=marine metagenome TaxID=408172 RepID=A0A382L0T0_9ZZZZ